MANLDLSLFGDYGLINGEGYDPSPRSPVHYTQVFMATHDGETHLQPRHRSFISFSFDGHDIEEWNLISITPGDRMERGIYSDFSDLTSEYDVLDGHFYWGTHLQGRTLSFVLATDEMTEAQLASFQRFFRPGKVADLILAETPNRKIRARVSSAPTYAVLAFGKKVDVKVGDTTFPTEITVYRGRINISFTSESPFWSAIHRIIDLSNLPKKWDASEGIKVMVDDEIPSNYSISNVNFYTGDMASSVIVEGEAGQLVGTAIVGSGRVGPALSTLIDAETNKSTAILSQNSESLLYYPGTAPGQPIVQFTLTPVIENGYVVAPYNFRSQDGPYNTLSIGNSSMRFTIPSLYSSYNKAIEIFSNCEGLAVSEVRAQLITETNEYYSRAYAIGILNAYVMGQQIAPPEEESEEEEEFNEENVIIDSDTKNNLVMTMQQFLLDDNNVLPALFTFDSKIGTAIGLIGCRLYSSEGGTVVTVKENVGDMMRSSYLLINDRNICSTNAYKVETNCCQEITTDYPNSLQNFYIEYDILYR